jgi:hypothetical protein
MSEHHLGYLPPNGAIADAVLEDIRDVEAAQVATQPEADPSSVRQPVRQPVLDRTAAKEPVAETSDVPNAADRAQLERDIAAIERASAALRRADPAMESWIDTPVTAMQKTRPVWLLIGVLWLSTALITIGAVFAISALVG